MEGVKRKEEACDEESQGCEVGTGRLAGKDSCGGAE